MRVITVSGISSASSTNLLQGSRLQTFPGPGILDVEFEADVTSAANNHELSLYLPDGQTPFVSQVAPANAQGTPGVIDAREQYHATFQVFQGGTAQLADVLTGTSVLAYRLTWRG